MRDVSRTENTTASRVEQVDLRSRVPRGQVFAGNPVDQTVMARILGPAEVFDWRFYERPALEEPGATMARLWDKAPGPDCVPFSAWKAAGAPVEHGILDFIEALMQGRRIEGLSDARVAFVPKAGVDGEEGSETASTSPERWSVDQCGLWWRRTSLRYSGASWPGGTSRAICGSWTW